MCVYGLKDVCVVWCAAAQDDSFTGAAAAAEADDNGGGAGNGGAGSGGRPPSGTALRHVRQLAALGASLRVLFASVGEADLEFGCFKALFGPQVRWGRHKRVG